MKLAPRMIQSMEILQLPLMALDERIEQEISENPCLERLASDPDAPEAEHNREEARENAAEKSVGEEVLQVDSNNNNEADFERLRLAAREANPLLHAKLEAARQSAASRRS